MNDKKSKTERDLEAEQQKIPDLDLSGDEEVDENFKPFVDHFQTAQQRKRDETITELLKEYSHSYAEKGRVKRLCQEYIMFVCGVFVVVSVFGIIGLSCRVIFTPESISDLNGLAAFVTAFIGFVSLVFGLITIITKYAFPENDEQYITEIVKAIQDNDLKHKIKNMELNKESSSDLEKDKKE